MDHAYDINYWNVSQVLIISSPPSYSWNIAECGVKQQTLH